MILIYTLILLSIIILIYILSIKPNTKRDMDSFLNYLYAHRGLHDNSGENPENSLLSFEMAIEEGFGIELDVHLTKDNIPVVFHDNNLLRMCGSKEEINELLFKDLEALRLFNTIQYIPTLEEVLNLIDGRVPLIVEIKNDTTDINGLKYIANTLDSYKGAYAIESFNPLVLMWYKKNRPLISRGQLSSYFKEKHHLPFRRFRDFFLENLMTNFLAKPDFIAFNYKHKNMFSFKLCKTLYRPITAAYTIKSQESLEDNLKDFNLFIFDNFLPKKDTDIH